MSKIPPQRVLAFQQVLQLVIVDHFSCFLFKMKKGSQLFFGGSWLSFYNYGLFLVLIHLLYGIGVDLVDVSTFQLQGHGKHIILRSKGLFQ